MLTEELLTINKIVQGDIATMDAIRWFIKLDIEQQRNIVSLTRMCLERAGPNQEGVDKVIDRWHRAIIPEVVNIFKENRYDQAIIKASEVQDEELGDSFIIFIELFRYFDDLQRKTICKNGCDHEWHNLTWSIRTNDIQKLVDFYSLAGVKPEYHKHGTSFHYSIKTGQSILKIYTVTKTRKDMGLGLRIKFTLDDFDEVIKTLKEKQVPLLGETETDVMVVVVDTDGRKIKLHKG